MIDYQRFVLANGLRLIVHEDRSTPMAAVSVQYDVGSRDECSERTGFAHLFEHLMFGGSLHAPDYDDPIQLAGGENNAFTNNDITNFHISIPAINLDTALWLEADRMAHLSIAEDTLDVQRRVVVEEFKETCLNEPYGDVWHHLSALAYHEHPYRWPVIGLEPRHVEEAQLEEVIEFYRCYYHAGNAIVVVVGPTPAETVFRRVSKYFGHLPAGPTLQRSWPVEPPLLRPRFCEVAANVAVDSLYLLYPMPERTHPDFYPIDLLTDALAEGASSRLYRRLLKERELVSSIDAYVTGTNDPGLIVFEAKPREGVTMAEVKAAIEAELLLLQQEPMPTLELEKIKNKLEAGMLFSELSIVNKAINLAFYEGIGDVALINTEDDIYAAVTAADIQRVAQQYLDPQRQMALYYRAAAASTPAGTSMATVSEDEL